MSPSESSYGSPYGAPRLCRLHDLLESILVPDHVVGHQVIGVHGYRVHILVEIVHCIALGYHPHYHDVVLLRFDDGLDAFPD